MKKQILKTSLYYAKFNLLFNKGLKSGDIVPFDDEFYSKLNNTYITGLPVSIHIKYLRPIIGPGKCLDRSLYMFFCFKNALLVRANNKDLELRYGKEDSMHGWIEIDNYVYDPSLLLRFDKDLYYKIYTPTDVSKYTIDEYCNIYHNRMLYEDISNTTINDLLPNGNKRIELFNNIPLIKEIANMSNNEDFINGLNDWLSTINYDEKEIKGEINEKIAKYIRTY